MASEIDATAVCRALTAAHEALLAARDLLHDLDAALGDGDHGDAVVAGFAAASSAACEDPHLPAFDVLQSAADALGEHMGGAAGPLYATVLGGLAAAGRDRGRLDLAALAAGAERAAERVERLGRVAEGDGSMIDALRPATSALEKHASHGADDLARALADAAAAAAQGAAATRDREKRRGRASSHPSRGVGYEDPGARSLAIVMEALAAAVGDAATGGPAPN